MQHKISMKGSNNQTFPKNPIAAFIYGMHCFTSAKLHSNDSGALFLKLSVFVFKCSCSISSNWFKRTLTHGKIQTALSCILFFLNDYPLQINLLANRTNWLYLKHMFSCCLFLNFPLRILLRGSNVHGRREMGKGLELLERYIFLQFQSCGNLQKTIL